MNTIKKIVVYILTWEARLILKRYKPRIIAVTGSVGKTTTKDAIYVALSGDLHVRKSEKSFNSDIGVPLAILGRDNGWKNPIAWLGNILYGLWIIVVKQEYPAWLVLEVGADRPGDIRKIAKWLRPDVVVITGVPEIPVHVEYFDSPEALLREKRALAEYLKPGGKLILNGDDLRMREVQAQYRGAAITYGIEADTDYAATHETIAYHEGKPIGMRFRLNHSGSSIPVGVYGALGRPRIYAALAALAVGETVGVDLITGAKRLVEFVPPAGRMRLIDGIRGSIIIDDTYNSSPAAAMSALDTLKEVTGVKKKIAIMGDMLELGRYSAEAHKALGVRAAQTADRLITIGFRTRTTAEAALDAGMRDDNILQYEQNESARAGAELESEIGEGDIILIKGSQSMRMERTVEEIMAEPQRASELLVRQDTEWDVR